MQGRILADTLIYQYENEEKMPCIIIESDPLAVDSLARHLAMYKLRSKVTISKTEFKVNAPFGIAADILTIFTYLLVLPSEWKF